MKFTKKEIKQWAETRKKLQQQERRKFEELHLCNETNKWED